MLLLWPTIDGSLYQCWETLQASLRTTASNDVALLLFSLVRVLLVVGYYRVRHAKCKIPWPAKWRGGVGEGLRLYDSQENRIESKL